MPNVINKSLYLASGVVLGIGVWEMLRLLGALDEPKRVGISQPYPSPYLATTDWLRSGPVAPPPPVVPRTTDQKPTPLMTAVNSAVEMFGPLALTLMQDRLAGLRSAPPRSAAGKDMLHYNGRLFDFTEAAAEATDEP